MLRGGNFSLEDPPETKEVRASPEALGSGGESLNLGKSIKRRWNYDTE